MTCFLGKTTLCCSLPENGPGQVSFGDACGNPILDDDPVVGCWFADRVLAVGQRNDKSTSLVDCAATSIR